MRPMIFLKEAMRLVSVQRIEDALGRLAEGLRIMKETGSAEDIVLVSRTAAVLCANNGRLREAAMYYEEATKVDPKDPYTRWALGDVYTSLGENDLAKKNWNDFVEIASASKDPEVRDFLEAHIARIRGKEV